MARPPQLCSGKISFKWQPNIESFIEGRNLTDTTRTGSIAAMPYADGTPDWQNHAFASCRITVGVNFRNM
ncbi:hypothetical protein IA69_15680 [Massilia sp. JS1662]|nr:hypothetical protein IA69_15680 [Massilia sp. JS1662]